MRQQEKLTTRQLLIPYIANFIGSVIAAIGINGFFIPQHLLSSGIGGVAISYGSSRRYGQLYYEHSCSYCLLQVYGTALYHPCHYRYHYVFRTH